MAGTSGLKGSLPSELHDQLTEIQGNEAKATERDTENADDEIIIHIQKKKSEDIDQVLRFISAFMNSDGGVIKLKNISYTNANPSDFDIWFSRVEKRLSISSSKFLKLNEFVDKPRSQIQDLLLKVEPLSDRICTLNSHLYITRHTVVLPVDGLEAFEILNSTDCSYTISQFPKITGTFEYGKQHPDAKEESDQVQLKEIKCEKRNIPNKFSVMVDKYISGFGNHKGGRIFFGINEDSQVVGVPLTDKDKYAINQIMFDKMEKNMQYGCEDKKPIKGEHWDIEFYKVMHSSKVEFSKEVIVVSVCKFPGGVFTAPPEAYYIDDSRQIKQYSVAQWKDKIMEKHKDVYHDQFEKVHDQMSGITSGIGQIAVGLTSGSSIETNQQPNILPSAIYRMDERSRELYKTALESGSEIKREIRVLVVGKQGAGKTSLIRQLLSRSLDDVKSTNGIEIHSVLCNDVNMSEIDWKLKTQTTDSRLLTGTIQTENRTTDSRNRTIDSRNRNAHSRNRTTDNTDTRGNNKLDLNSSNIEKLEGLDESAKKQEAEDAPLLDDKVKNGGDSGSETEDKENQDLKDIIMADVIDENDIRISIWDFGGDEEFYHTHQVFLAEDVVFLVVTSLVDSAQCSQGELRFWFDTIHCLCKDEGKSELNPPCIVIGTHKDKIQSSKDVGKIMEEKLNTVKDLKKHIHSSVHFISNTKGNKDDISEIKMAIIRAAKENKEWQTKHPLKFILLDKALEMMKKESAKKPVVTFDDIECANKQLTNPLTVDELDLYLRYNHRLGHLIYYADIPEHIVINPQWLCDIFRYIVTADKFRPDLQRIDWEKVRNTGEVTQTVLEEIFKIEKVDEEHQLYLLNVMEKFHILIRPSMFSEISEKEQCPRYFAPCIIRNKELRDLNGLFKTNFNKSTCLCIKCKFIPPFIFNHIIIFFCKTYASAKAPDGIPMFFSNGAIFDITSNMCEKLVVVKQNYIIQLQVLMFGKPKVRSYTDIKSRIEQKITHICETFSVKIKDEWKWKCPETSYTNCDGLMEFADCEESLCIECEKLHSSTSYWFENSPSLTRTSILSKGDEEVRKGSLYDLEDNQKRWLLIGIDLHNIIAPALRKYVAPRLNQLWTTLKNNNHIDTQQYPNQLKEHLKIFLNYESINNNKSLGRNQQKNYDYCVKGPVDLSKLFHLPHMAHYTGFDDSCDSSALLGIIINSGICPAHGTKCAEKVRSEIRNKWAHSNFTEWDDTKYQNSLQLLEQLVKSLGLSNEEENEIFSQLIRWKNNGKEFIEGTTPESVALKDISKQFQTMVVRVQHLEQVVQEKIRELTEKMAPPVIVYNAEKIEIHNYHGSKIHK